MVSVGREEREGSRDLLEPTGREGMAEAVTIKWGLLFHKSFKGRRRPKREKERATTVAKSI